MSKIKTYLVVCLEETDGGCLVKQMTGEEIRKMVKESNGDQSWFTLIEGNVIKGESNKIDLSKL